MPTSYGISQIGILNALMDGKTKSEIYDAIDKKKEKLFDKGVKPSTIEKMDKLFDKRFDNAMDDYRYKLKNRPGMKEYRKKQRSAKGSDTGSEFKSGGKVLKPVDKSKNPGLAKLPTQVRNKMGYMKDGGKVKKGKKVKPLGKKPKPGSYDYYLLNKPKHSPAPIKPKPKMRSGGRVMQKSNGMSRRGMGKAMRGGGCVR